MGGSGRAIGSSSHGSHRKLSQASALQQRRCCLSSCHVLSGASTGTENTFNFQSDNEAVITALDTKSCKDISLMYMVRCLFFFQAHYSFHTQRGISLVLTTHWLMLYRVTMLFLSKVPNADKIPTHIPQELMELLVIQKPDWTSQSWTTLFSTILNKV